MGLDTRIYGDGFWEGGDGGREGRIGEEMGGERERGREGERERGREGEGEKVRCA